MVTKTTRKGTVGRFRKSKEEMRAKARSATRKAPSNGVHTLLRNLKGLPIWEPDNLDEIRLSVIPYEQTSEYNPDFQGECIDVEEGACWWRRIFATHYINGKYYICPKITHGKNCPICESEYVYWDEWKAQGGKKGNRHEEITTYINRKIRPNEWVAIVADVTVGDSKTSRKLFVSKYNKYNKYIDFILEGMSGKASEHKDDEKRKAEDMDYKKIRKKFAKENFNGKEIELFYCFDERFDLVFDVELCGEGPYAHKALSSWKSIDFIESEDIDDSVVEDIPKLDEIFVTKEYDELKQIWEDGDDLSEKDEDEAEEYPKEPELDKVKQKSLKTNINKELEKINKTKEDDEWDDDSEPQNEEWDEEEKIPEKSVVEETTTEQDSDDWDDWGK